MKRLLLIDANALIHRFYHALPPLTSPKGEPVGALYGLSKVLLKILREQKTDYVVAAFDRREKTFRSDLAADYKATRQPTADDLIPQLKEAHNIFNGFGIRTIDLAGYEADDLIGTLAEKFKGEPDLQVAILTGDRDLLQLVDKDKVIVDLIRKGVDDVVIYDETMVKEKYELAPDQLVEYKGLVGDPSDNIKGVPGVGPKTATELLKEFGTIEKIFEDIAIIPEKKAKKLVGQEEQARLSKKLATIVRDAPIENLTLQDIKIKKPTTTELKNFFESYGFTSLAKQLDSR
jgi:DNA polymerase I